METLYFNSWSSVWPFSPCKTAYITQLQCYVMSVTKTSKCIISVGGKGGWGSGGGLCYSAENLAAVGILYDILLTGASRLM